MKEAEKRATQESMARISSMKNGLYAVLIHGFRTRYKIENGKIYGNEIKGNGRIVWYETFVDVKRIDKLEIIL